MLECGWANEAGPQEGEDLDAAQDISSSEENKEHQEFL